MQCFSGSYADSLDSLRAIDPEGFDPPTPESSPPPMQLIRLNCLQMLFGNCLTKIPLKLNKFAAKNRNIILYQFEGFYPWTAFQQVLVVNRITVQCHGTSLITCLLAHSVSNCKKPLMLSATLRNLSRYQIVLQESAAPAFNLHRRNIVTNWDRNVKQRSYVNQNYNCSRNNLFEKILS